MSKNNKGPAIESIYADYILKMGIYKHRNGDLYKWTGHHYEHIPQKDAEKDAFLWLRSYPEQRKSSIAKSCVESALLSLPNLTLLEDEPNKRCIIPTKHLWIEAVFDEDSYGRTLHPKFVLRLPDPAVGIVNEVPVEIPGEAGDVYRPTPIQQDSMFAKFLKSSFPAPNLMNSMCSSADEESAESLMSIQEYAGYSLLLGRNEQKAHLWSGSGANGKGVMTELLMKFNKSFSVDLTRLDGFSLSGIQDSALVVVDETPKGGFDEEKFKSLVAGSTTKIDRKYRDAVDVRTHAKWIICSNQEFGIRCRNSGEGFWRRMIMVNWKHTIPDHQRIVGLSDRIFQHECKSVMDWMLIGLMRYLQRGGKLFVSRTSEATKATSMANSDIVMSWWSDIGGTSELLLPLGTKGSRKEDVYTAFKLHCEANGRQAVNSQEFWTRLYKMLGTQIKDFQGRVSGAVVRFINIDISKAGSGHLAEPSPSVTPCTVDFREATSCSDSLYDDIYGTAEPFVLPFSKEECSEVFRPIQNLSGYVMLPDPDVDQEEHAWKEDIHLNLDGLSIPLRL